VRVGYGSTRGSGRGKEKRHTRGTNHIFRNIYNTHANLLKRHSLSETFMLNIYKYIFIIISIRVSPKLLRVKRFISVCTSMRVCVCFYKTGMKFRLY
jgi:hypothetical protein